MDLFVFVNGDNVTYFDSFRVEHISKEIKKFIGHKNVKTDTYRIQANDSIMSGYFFMLKGKSLLDYTNLLFPNAYEKNDK